MDPIRTGALIRQLRTDQRMTQKELAERIHVSDKAVSKWERGNGCPDIDLFPALAAVLGTDTDVLLAGDLHQKESEKGDMKRLKFYVCKTCGNLITAASESTVTCCGTRLAPEEPRLAEEQERLRVEALDGEWYITSAHPMTKTHYISFVAYVSDSSLMLFRQYPEWNLQVTIPQYRSGRLVWYCTEHGLQYQMLDVRRPQTLFR